MDLKQLKERYVQLAGLLEEATNLLANEKRAATEKEREDTIKIIDEMENIDKEVDRMELEERMTATLQKAKESRKAIQRPNPYDMTGEKKGFRSLGEFLQAVYTAGVSPRVDQRLRYESFPNAEFRAASGLSEGVPADGGFLVQTDIAQDLFQLVFQTGVLASKCKRVPISGNSNSMKINAISETSRATGSRLGGVRAYWLNEAGTKTSSKPTFRQIELNLKKLIGLCYATDEMLQDAASLGAIIRDGFGSEFGFQTDDAIINGTGVGMPLGILNSGCLVTQAKDTAQTATTFTGTNAINMWSRMLSPSKPNSIWLCNTDVVPQLMGMYLGTTAPLTYVYVPPGGLSAAPYGTLLGRTVLEIEQCQTLGTKGDVYLADFSNYIIGEKGGIATDTSIHVKFTTDETAFRFVMRLDGQPTLASAITPFKGSNTLSPFVCVETRS